MPTIRQILKKPRKRIDSNKKSVLNANPQKKGVCLKVYTMNPKKPNSADRKVAKVQLSNTRVVIGYIPGEKHTLQQHSLVLIEGGRKRDLPGIKYCFVKNVYDFTSSKN